jgi:hypothetical protein
LPTWPDSTKTNFSLLFKSLKLSNCSQCVLTKVVRTYVGCTNIFCVPAKVTSSPYFLKKWFSFSVKLGNLVTWHLFNRVLKSENTFELPRGHILRQMKINFFLLWCRNFRSFPFTLWKVTFKIETHRIFKKNLFWKLVFSFIRL